MSDHRVWPVLGGGVATCRIDQFCDVPEDGADDGPLAGARRLIGTLPAVARDIAARQTASQAPPHEPGGIALDNRGARQ